MAWIRPAALATAIAVALLAIGPPALGPRPAPGGEISGHMTLPPPPPIIRVPLPNPVPEMRPMDPADVERLEREEAAHEAERRRRTDRDIDFWERWHDAAQGIKVIVGGVNNVVGGLAVAACFTGVGCIPVAIYAGGKVVEVLLVSHAEASHGTDFVGRLINGSASSGDRWRRTRINGFGTMASEVIGLGGYARGWPSLGAKGLGASGGASAGQEAMGEFLNDGYEAIQESNERMRQDIWQREADRATAEAYGLDTSGGFPMPRGAPFR